MYNTIRPTFLVWKSGGNKKHLSNVDNVGYSTWKNAYAPGLNQVGTIPLTGCSVGTNKGLVS